jgi:molybdopterin-guanine dinucleotide biosynthesis protein
VIRVAITGSPRAGKTTLAIRVADEMRARGTEPNVRHTDSLISKLQHLGRDAWSAASAEVATWFDAAGPWIVEGVSVSRALRKWHANHPGERPPVDRVIHLTVTVHSEIEPWLAEHGIRTERLTQQAK